MQVLCLSLVWGWRMAMFQLSGFYSKPSKPYSAVFVFFQKLQGQRNLTPTWGIGVSRLGGCEVEETAGNPL